MTFTEVVLSGAGEILARRRHAWEDIRAGETGADFTRRFDLLLALFLPPDRSGPVTFCCPVCQGRGGRLLWTQSEPYSATVFFDLRGVAAANCLLLSGRDPAGEVDELALVQRMLAEPQAGTGRRRAFRLRSVIVRPALIRIEAGSGLSAEDRRVEAELALSLAAVFFRWVATPSFGRIDQE